MKKTESINNRVNRVARTLLGVLFTTLTMTASADGSYKIRENLYCYLFQYPNSNEAWVTSGDELYTGSVNIPRDFYYNGATYVVTKIGDEAFKNCTSMTSVTIPETVTEIGKGAFSNCQGLTSIDLPDGLFTIADHTFEYCNHLTSMTIPNGVTEIGDGAFDGCSGMTSVTIPSSVTKIGDYAFWSCGSLTSLNIPASVTSIGEKAFGGCDHLTSVTVESGNEYYDSREGCNAIIRKSDNQLIVGSNSTVIPFGVASIADGVFYNCDGLTSITIPSSVTSIDAFAFQECDGLTRIAIPSSVTSIGNSVFSGCDNLTSIKVEWGSPISIGSDVFSDIDCSKITLCVPIGMEKTYRQAAVWGDFGTVKGVAYDFYDDESGLYFAYLTGNTGTQVKVVSGENPYSDESYVIPSVVYYQDRSYAVTMIDDEAFYGCDYVRSVTLPSGLTTIGKRAFCYCSFRSITIPRSVYLIGEEAFAFCVWVEEITVDSNNYMYSSPEGSNAILSDNTLVVGCKNTVIPSTVTAIGDYAFRGVGGAITLPDGLTTIGKYAFASCRVVHLTIPASVTSIGENAFYDCSNLATITVDEDNTVYDSREGCNAIIRKSDNTLLVGCKNTVIPSSVAAIGNCAFRSCDEMTTLEIPEGVTTIGRDAFAYCTDLASVTIPASVTSIGANAFMVCESLTSVTVRWATPLDISDEYVFYGCDNLSTATLRVPTGTADAYRQAVGWGDFGTIEEYVGGGTCVLVIDETHFPDAKFREYLLSQTYGADGFITDKEISTVTRIELSGDPIMWGAIQDLTGIGYFTELTYLGCSFNRLESLNLSANTKLLYLYCDGNLLTSLDLSANTALTSLYCYANKLTSLDLSNNTALISLRCGNNELTSLDLSANTQLTSLECEDNNISGDGMDCLVGSLPERASNDGQLRVCAKDTYNGSENVITTAQVQTANGRGWTVYRLEGTEWVEYAGTLSGVEINEANFPDAKFREYLLSQTYGADGFITDEEIATVTSIDVYGSPMSYYGITDLTGIGYFTELTNLKCGFNRLESLNLSANKKLLYLDCSCAGLNALDLSANKQLRSLDCYANQLEQLDLRWNHQLEYLRCGDNQLTSLDLRWNMALTSLDCGQNALTSLNLSRNTALTSLQCENNNISGEEMDALVNSLPDGPGELKVCSNDSRKDNVITAAQVQAARNKDWMVQILVYDQTLGYNVWTDYGGLGDVNADGGIDQDDLDLIVKIIMGQAPQGVGKYAGDLNKDGKTDAADIVKMINILNALNELP